MATTEAEHVDTAPKSDIFEEALRGELVKFLTPTVAGVHSALDSVEERQDELMLKINELINKLSQFRDTATVYDLAKPTAQLKTAGKRVKKLQGRVSVISQRVSKIHKHVSDMATRERQAVEAMTQEVADIKLDQANAMGRISRETGVGAAADVGPVASFSRVAPDTPKGEVPVVDMEDAEERPAEEEDREHSEEMKEEAPADEEEEEPEPAE